MNKDLKNSISEEIYSLFSEEGIELEKDEKYSWEDFEFENDNYETYSGATKKVIVFADYVVKIPYNYGTHSNYPFDFKNAYLPLTQKFYWDYCKREQEIYHLAQEHNLDFLFAPNIRISNKKDYPIYYQEKCWVFSDVSHSYISVKQKEKLVRSINNSKLKVHGSIAWLVEVEKIYGLDIVLKLMKFCEDYDIQDLHWDNFGYTKDKKPIIFDYGGYDEGNTGEVGDCI